VVDVAVFVNRLGLISFGIGVGYGVSYMVASAAMLVGRS